MNLHVISANATVAIACAIVFLLVAKFWHRLTRMMAGHPSFADSIMSEAAQRFRDELQALSRKQASYLGAGLVFVVMFSVASIFQVPQLFLGYPDWQLYALMGTLIAAALFAVYRLALTIVSWRQIRLRRDANIAVGQQLQRIAADLGRSYHDVSTSTGIVDHVLVGHSGVYAINVVARRKIRQGSVHLEGNELKFSNSEKTCSIVAMIAATHRLNKELRKLAGHDIRVRSVIAVPGWDIQNQPGNDHLLVNERTLPMLTGWKDQADFLMNEDVTALQGFLTARCTISTP